MLGSLSVVAAKCAPFARDDGIFAGWRRTDSGKGKDSAPHDAGEISVASRSPVDVPQAAGANAVFRKKNGTRIVPIGRSDSRTAL